MIIGQKVKFLNSVRCVNTTSDGYIIEYGPIVSCLYEYMGNGVYHNITQPHHLIYWFLDFDNNYNGTNVKAVLQVQE